ncbi:hypothetical protein JCM8097_001241 [Rhodosporidiobolus ruineniae]
MPPVLDFAPAPLAQPDDTRRAVEIWGSPIEQSVWSRLMRHVLPRINLPHHVASPVDCPDIEAEGSPWREAKERPEYLGACFTMPCKLQALRQSDALDAAGEATGSANTIYLRPAPPGLTSESPALAAAGLVQVGSNTDAPAVTNILLSALLSTPTPFPANAPRFFAPGQAAALAIGGGGAVRAVLHALHANLGCSRILLLNRDRLEAQAVIDQFPKLDIRFVDSVERAEKEMQELEGKGMRLAVGIGAIPCEEPQTEGEKTLYAAAEKLFEWKYQRMEGKEQTGLLKLPEKPIFLDMAYKPRFTLLRQSAEKHGWVSLCGDSAVLEVVFEQIKLWTSIDVPRDVRDSARELLRSLQ